MPPHPTFFVRKTVYKQHGGFDLSFTSAADYELMLAILVQVPDVVCILTGNFGKDEGRRSQQQEDQKQGSGQQ